MREDSSSQVQTQPRSVRLATDHPVGRAGCNVCTASLNTPSAVAAMWAASQWVSSSIITQLVEGNRRWPHQAHRLSCGIVCMARGRTVCCRGECALCVAERNVRCVLQRGMCTVCCREACALALNTFNDGEETLMHLRLLEKTVRNQK